MVESSSRRIPYGARCQRDANGLILEIADSGAGVPPEAQAHIFEPFFTTKLVGQGTGLGLDAANRIVAKHRGTIRFESRHGRTAFQVHLPCSATEPRP